LPVRILPLDTTCVLSERWPVEPFDGQFPDPRFRTEMVTFQVAFDFKRYSIFNKHNLTIISLKHNFFWDGDELEFANWGRGDGGAQIARHISQLVNRLIDIVQTTFDETDDNPFPHLRHVGIRDFVVLDSLYGDRRQNLISYGMLGMDARFAKRSIGIISKVGFRTENYISNEKTKIIRTVELLNSGYHTEALLISFSVLDDSVQEALRTLIEERGVANPDEIIRAISENRLTRFLGPLLKLVTGHSLEEENHELWKNLGKCNKYRNQAIHESIDVSYDDAKLCIETVRDILLYLGSIPKREPQDGSSEIAQGFFCKMGHEISCETHVVSI
jgi:hypothetical protein